MPSRTQTIADALTDWLNDRDSRSWPVGIPTWRATRVWEAVEEVKDGDGLLVQVAPITRTPMTLITRGSKDQSYQHEIYVRERYTEAGEIPNEWIDMRVQLVESMEDQLFDMTQTPPANVNRVFVPVEDGVSIDTICDQFDLNELRQFTAILAVTLREIRNR